MGMCLEASNGGLFKSGMRCFTIRKTIETVDTAEKTKTDNHPVNTRPRNSLGQVEQKTGITTRFNLQNNWF